MIFADVPTPIGDQESVNTPRASIVVKDAFPQPDGEAKYWQIVADGSARKGFVLKDADGTRIVYIGTESPSGFGKMFLLVNPSGEPIEFYIDTVNQTQGNITPCNQSVNPSCILGKYESEVVFTIEIADGVSIKFSPPLFGDTFNTLFFLDQSEKSPKSWDGFLSPSELAKYLEGDIIPIQKAIKDSLKILELEFNPDAPITINMFLPEVIKPICGGIDPLGCYVESPSSPSIPINAYQNRQEVILTIIHELAHARLPSLNDAVIAETIAEMIAYAVLQIPKENIPQAQNFLASRSIYQSYEGYQWLEQTPGIYLLLYFVQNIVKSRPEEFLRHFIEALDKQQTDSDSIISSRVAESILIRTAKNLNQENVSIMPDNLNQLIAMTLMDIHYEDKQALSSEASIIYPANKANSSMRIKLDESKDFTLMKIKQHGEAFLELAPNMAISYLGADGEVHVSSNPIVDLKDAYVDPNGFITITLVHPNMTGLHAIGEYKSIRILQRQLSQVPPTARRTKNSEPKPNRAGPINLTPTWRHHR